MKSLIFAAVVCFSIITTTSAQEKLPQPDKSPMDVSYLPANYPILKVQNKIAEPPLARVLYSRPTKNGRQVYGELVEYGKVWRLGANEATEIELYKDLKIAGKKVAKGRYSMFAIPFENQWTIILNKDTDVWGAFRYDEKKDVLRFTATTEKLQQKAEMFSMFFDDSQQGVNLVITWDDTKATIPFSYQ